MNPVTSGPCVNESLETNMEGVFACGNVLHVHDLVDFVSEEAASAGRNAAAYVKAAGDGKTEQTDADAAKAAGTEAEQTVQMVATSGVRYTVPSMIRLSHMDESLTVRFRVGGVYKNCFVSVWLDDERIVHRKKQVLAPGEMEEVKLTKEQLSQYPELKTITFKIEEA